MVHTLRDKSIVPGLDMGQIWDLINIKPFKVIVFFVLKCVFKAKFFSINANLLNMWHSFLKQGLGEPDPTTP